MKHRYGRLSWKQILLYTGLMAAAFIIVVLYMMGGNEVFEEPKDEVVYKYEDKVTLPMYNVRTLCPMASTDEDTYQIAPLIYDSLFVLDETMTPQPDLVKTYKFNKKKRTLTLTLINTKWQDGKKLTAGDVVFSINGYKVAGDKCNYKDMLDGIDYAEEKDGKVVIHFLEPLDMSVDMLLFPILPSHKFDGDYYKAMDAGEKFRPVGTGQYKVKKYDPTSRLVLVPYDGYHGTKATNTLTFDIDSMKGDPYQLLQAGGITVYVTGDWDRSTRVTKKDIKLVDFPANRLEFVGFNCDDGHLKDAGIRQAICYTVDRQTIIDREYYGSGILNDDLYFPGYMGTGQDGEEAKYPYDLKKAGDLLSKAGYSEYNGEGYLCNGEGEPLTIEILVDRSREERCGAAEILAQSLTDLGAKVHITRAKHSEYRSLLESGQFDIYFGSYTFDSSMDMRALLGYDETNMSRFEDPELIGLLDELRSGLTIEEMKDVYLKIREITTTEVPYYCLMYRTYGAMLSTSFEGECKPVWNNYYRGCGQWQSKYPVKTKTTEETDEQE